MPNVKNPSLIFAKVPIGRPKPGVDLLVRDRPLDTDSPPKGGFITKNLYSSLDPYMRGLLIGPDKTTYRPAFTLGEPIASGSIAKVIASDHVEYKLGDIIQGRLPLQEYSSLTLEYLKSTKPPAKIQNPYDLKDLRLCLGPLGMPGLTAFSSFYEICAPKAGETIFISAASGAVGQVVGQIAKREGLRVIGSVGSDDKLAYITEELGFNGGFNYKTELTSDALKRLAPEGLDIYYDNVGGPQLEAAISHMKLANGRIAVCGMISQYNLPDEEKYGVKNLFQLVAKGITMRGFKQQDKDFGPKWSKRHQQEVGRWLSERSIKASIDERIGVEAAGEAFVDLLDGRNFGKMVVNIHGDVDDRSQ